MFQIMKSMKKKIEIEIKVIKRGFCTIYKKQLSICFTDCKYESKGGCKILGKCIIFLISLAACFFLFGGFLIFV